MRNRGKRHDLRRRYFFSLSTIPPGPVALSASPLRTGTFLKLFILCGGRRICARRYGGAGNRGPWLAEGAPRLRSRSAPARCGFRSSDRTPHGGDTLLSLHTPPRRPPPIAPGPRCTRRFADVGERRPWGST